MGEADVYPKPLRQAFMRREFLAVVQRQGVPHLRGYRLESTDGSLIQSRCRLIRHDFSQEQCGLSVNKRGYIGVFTGAFYGIAFLITHSGLLFNDFRAFVDGNTANYLAPAVFCPLPMAWFYLKCALSAGFCAVSR
jgi:hypothetical protein